MIILIYIAKASLCMAIVLAIYILLLGKERIFRFNRYYLIVGLIAAHIIPLIETPFGLIKETPEFIQSEFNLSETFYSFQTETIIEQTPYMTWDQILIWMYGFISISLLIQLGHNLFQFRLKRIRFPKIHFEEIPLVLTNLNESPHSFLRTIYSNKGDYDRGVITETILIHEATHVRQLHSLDILLISLFQAVGWANPLYYAFRRLIQINHEYLADQNVIQRTHDIYRYQNLLLDSIESQSKNQLASNINFLITKKRLNMMTKTTSQHKAWVLRLGSAIVLISMIFLYGEITGQTAAAPKVDEEVQSATKSPDDIVDGIIAKIDIEHFNFDELSQTKFPRTPKDEYFKNTTIVYLDGHGNELLRKKYAELTQTQRDALSEPPPPPPPADPNGKVTPSMSEPEGTLVYFMLEETIYFKLEVRGRSDIIERPVGTIRIVRPEWPTKFSSDRSDLSNY